MKIQKFSKLSFFSSRLSFFYYRAQTTVLWKSLCCCHRLLSHSQLHSSPQPVFYCLLICFSTPMHNTIKHFMIHQFASFHQVQNQGTIHLLRQDSPMELFLLSSLLRFQASRDQRLMLSVLSMHGPKRFKRKCD